MDPGLPGGLPPELRPLAWLVGLWRGEGTVGYPTIDHSGIVQEIEFAHDGGPYLAYSAATRLVASDGTPGQIWHVESGYWRVAPGQTGPAGAPPFEIEVLTADPAGYVTVYAGEADGHRITLASDLLARTAAAAQMTAGKRLYGLVESELLWAWDIAAFGQPLQSYMAARLSRRDAL